MDIFPRPTVNYLNNPTSFTDPTQPRLSAAGKIVLVTGGGAGIGPAEVEAFAKAKADHVFISGRREAPLKEVAERLSPRYPQTKFHTFPADVSKEGDVQALFKAIDQVGRLDVLVANAGYLPTPGAVAVTDTAEWWKGFDINVLGTYLLAKAFVNQTRPVVHTPVFIGLNTGAAHVGSAVGPMSSYAASKLAAATVLEFLQTENKDIKVFSVSPGVVETDMAVKSNKPLPTDDSPELMGHTAVWLAGPDSDFLNGRFIWANWDLEELSKSKDKITSSPHLLRVTLDGWSNSFSVFK